MSTENQSFHSPGNIEVGFWVSDGELFSTQLCPNFNQNGTPSLGVIEVTKSTYNYFTWALGETEPCPRLGNNSGNLSSAILQARDTGEGSWKVNTKLLSNTKRGVISLSYLCAAINQISGASNFQWRINWICCREHIVG